MLIYYPHKTLLTVSEEVTEFGNYTDLPLLVDRMTAIMDEYEGVGLAANQVGEARRVIVVKTGKVAEPMINPIIIESFEEVSTSESCLSLPGISADVKRAKFIEMKYQNLEGEWQELTARDLLAAIIQHEIDHLNGITLLQKVSSIYRPRLAKQVRKMVHKMNRRISK